MYNKINRERIFEDQTSRHDAFNYYCFIRKLCNLREVRNFRVAIYFHSPFDRLVEAHHKFQES